MQFHQTCSYPIYTACNLITHGYKHIKGEKNMSMNNTKTVKMAMEIMISVVLTLLINTSALAEQTLTQEGSSAENNMRSQLSDSMNRADRYISDSTITASVKKALFDTLALKGIDISVKTDSGRVTLSGFVSSKAQVKQATHVTQRVKGVKSVNNKLRVKTEKKQSMSSYAEDTAITSEIKIKLLADDIVPSKYVRVSTIEGVVRLSGAVDSYSQSRRVEEVAKAVNGVKSVDNELIIKP